MDLDLGALQELIGWELRGSERSLLRDTQRRAYQRTFVDAGRQHPRFVATFRELDRLAA